MKEVPDPVRLLVLMGANTRAGRRGAGGLGSENCKILGADGRDTLNDNGERPLFVSATHGLALLDTFSSTAKNTTSHTFNERNKTCFDYMLTKQRDRKLVRDVIVHPQPPFLPISDHNIAPTHFLYVSTCVCMVSTSNKVYINRLWLPTLLVVS